MSQFIKVATKKEIETGKMKRFTIKDGQITLANANGEYFAFDDKCTHAQCSLAGGFLDGYTLTCYCHGGQYDIRTGKVLSPPPPAPISSYKVKVEGEDILVEI